MSTSYDRTFRAEILGEGLAAIAGESSRLSLKERNPEADMLSDAAAMLANSLLLPEYDTDQALDKSEQKYKEYREELEKLKAKNQKK